MNGIQVVELQAKNYLNLRDLSLELGQLIVLVGPNASGKSNVVKAFRALSALARGGPDELYGELGMEFEELAFRGVAPEVSLGVKLNVDGKLASYKVRFGRHFFDEELVSDGRRVLESQTRPDEQKTYTYLTKTGETVAKGPFSLSYPEEIMGIPRPELGLWNVPQDADEGILRVKEVISAFRAHSFEPSRLRATNEIGKEFVLSYTGDNLARVLFNVYLERREVFTEIEEFLASVVPEVEQILTPLKSEKEVQIAIREKSVERPLSYRQIADGTLRLLAFITALHLDSTLVAFEEPENCVHPHLLETLVDMLRKAPCQVVVTTHSPYLLDYVKPEEIVVVEKIEGETKARRLSEPEELERVRRMLEEGLTMGEIWYSGEVGGVPR